MGPNPGPQTALLDCPFEDVFYGGARGGGKTWGLLLDFGYLEKRWGAAARGVLFRRHYPDLEDVIVKGKDLLIPMGARYNAQNFTFTWPSGAFLRLRHMDRESDADKYQGHQYSWQGFDELQHWSNSKGIDKLWATLRSSESDVPKLRRSTGNPGGMGHQWVYDRYIRAGPWKVQQIVPEAARQLMIEVKPIQRVWIPAKLEDNKALMENDPDYESRLAESGGPKLFRAWRFGDWGAIEGAYFDWDGRVGGRHVFVDRKVTIPYWAPRWISMDWGFAHPAAILWHAWVEEWKKFVTYRERIVREKTAEELAEMIVWETKRNEEVLQEIILSFDCFARKVDEQTLAWRMNQVFQKEDLPGPIVGMRKRVQGWRHMDDLLRHDRWMVAESCEGLREAMPAMMHDPDDREDCLKFDGDDAPESARIGLATFPLARTSLLLDDFVKARVPLVKKKADGTEMPTDPIQREIDMHNALVEWRAEGNELG